MEAIKTRLKTIAWFLTALMLFQSCVVYHKTPTTLEKASREQVKTKVTKTNGDIFKYKFITYEDGVFYGVNVDPGGVQESIETARTPLNEVDVDGVFLKNKSASTWVTILSFAVPVLTIAIISAAGSVNPSPSF